jgi:hypothetical protein
VLAAWRLLLCVCVVQGWLFCPSPQEKAGGVRRVSDGLDGAIYGAIVETETGREVFLC